MSVISVSNLTFCYDGSYDNIFNNVSFTIDSDWRLGLIGRNGRGKTTLLNLLMGKYAYRGTISSQVEFKLFPFMVENIELNTLDIIQNTVKGFALWELEREMSLMELSEDILYRPFATLSNGERTKALLAALFMNDERFLLIDEPTNHLDLHGRKVLGAYLKRKKGFILVSHDRMLLDTCANHILSLNKADITVQKGNFTTWERDKTLRDEFELAENQRLEKDMDKLNKASARAAGWSDALEKTKIGHGPCDRGFIGAKSEKMMKRAKSIETRRRRAAEEKSLLLKNIEYASSLKLSPLTHYSPMLIEADGLTISFGCKTVCENITFTVEHGDRIAVTGRNGCGKSSVIKLLIGEDIPYKGTLRTASGLIVSYVPQDTSFLKGDLKDFAIEVGIDESLFKTILRKLDFSRLQFEKDMSQFSQGQKKKTLLAASLCQKAHVYVWDEPLNYIDVLSRMQIERLILSCSPTMLLVEHDARFIDNVANRILKM